MSDAATRAEAVMDEVLGRLREFLGHLHTLSYQARSEWAAEYLDIQREAEKLRLRLLRTNSARLESERGG